jgi:hypothetical protein
MSFYIIFNYFTLGYYKLFLIILNYLSLFHLKVF